MAARLQVRLRLEHILLADAIEIRFETLTVRRIIEQRSDDFRQSFRTRYRQRIPVTEFNEVLQTDIVKMRGNHMIDFVCVEFSIGIHVVRILIERRMMQISSGSF